MEKFCSVSDARHGAMLYNKNDQYIGRSFAEYGQFSEGEVECFRSILKEGDVVLDVGANIGAHTIPLAKMVGESGHIYAFEPQRIPYYMLCGNVVMNNLVNVHALNCAISDKGGRCIVPDLNPRKQMNFGGLDIEGHKSGETVSQVKIDGLGLKSCALIKIDVEGMEEKVLRGAVETIKRYKPVLYVENDREDKSESLVRFISGLGYNIEKHEPPFFEMNNWMKNPKNVFGTIVSKNLLCTFKIQE